MGKKYLVWDSGIFCEQAAALSDGGKNEVRYYTPWQTAFPKFTDYAVGKNFDNLEKVFYFGEHIDWADCICNFDVGGNDIIGFLRDKFPEKSIFGSGWGQKLEDDRIILKEFIKSFGLPMQDYTVIYGVKNLREYLQKHKDVYVKLNRFRTDAESFHSPDYKSVEQKINVLETVLGPHANDSSNNGFPFVIEETIKTDVEIGFDGFFNGTDYGTHAFVGYEWHKGPYIAKVTPIEEIPEPIWETMGYFQEVLKRINYRGALSTEEKIISTTEHYFLDICGRLPSPLSALYPQYIKNWADMVYKIGKGEPFDMSVPYKYVAALPFNSEETRTNYMKINIKDRDCVKLQMGCGDENGDYYAVKGLETAAIVIAGGDTIEETIKNLEKNCEAVDAIDLNKDTLNGLGDKFKELIDKGREVGIDF